MLMRDVYVDRAAATSVITENMPRAACSNSRYEIGRLHRDPRIGGVIDELQPAELTHATKANFRSVFAARLR